jgi:hypothetical protein
MFQVPDREVRAEFSAETITVYQAYGPDIASPAVAAGTFVPPFKRERMTWIKPSFRWMMYRSDWATKPGQERVLAVRISRSGFEWALAHASLSHFDRRCHASREEWQAQQAASPVRVQWDPERGTNMTPLPHRAIQVGLSGEAVDRYADEWITGIDDITELVAGIHRNVRAGHLDKADAAIPREDAYPLPDALRHRLGASY